MSEFDVTFARTCRSILQVYTKDVKMIFNHYEKYPLSDAESHAIVPILTIERSNFKSYVNEMLSIFRKYLTRKRYSHAFRQNESLDNYRSAVVCNEYGHFIVHDPKVGALCDANNFTVWMDPVDSAIWSLKNDPPNRSIFINMQETIVNPGLYSVSFSVEHRIGSKPCLHVLMHQGSCNMLTDYARRITQCSVLAHMIAQLCELEAGNLCCVTENAYIHEQEIPIAQELIQQIEGCELHHNPILWINRDIRSFEDFSIHDVYLMDYKEGGA